MHWGVGGEAHQLLDLIALRGTDDDWDNIVKLSTARRFWTATAAKKAATLHKYFATDRLAGEFTPQDYPVRYLEGHTPNSVVWEMGQKGLDELRLTSV